MTRPNERIPLVDLKAQYATIQHEVREAIDRVLASQRFILGEEVQAFESEFSRFTGAAHTVGVSSGTSAVHLALEALGIGRGDEVITTPFTFFATAEAIAHTGATPIFADIDPTTLNLDPAKLAGKLTPRTKAIVPVHIHGAPADMDPILAFARANGLKVVEDAAQAHGARYQGRSVGTLADAAAFSFFPGKNLGAYGDAGGITTTDAALAARIAQLRDHGRETKYTHATLGYNHRIDALQAAILRVKLRHLEAWNKRRAQIALAYDKALAGSSLTRGALPDWADSAHHLYVVRTERRDAIAKAMLADGIETGVHYPVPLHLQPVYASRGEGPGTYPVAERAALEVLSLPIYAEMTDAQVARVASSALAAAGRNS